MFIWSLKKSTMLAIDQDVVETSWLMDMYACFHKTYVHHVIFILGVNHIKQMKSFINSLEIVLINSSQDKNNPIQCLTNNGLTFV